MLDFGTATREELDALLAEMKRRGVANTLAMEPFIVQLADAGWTIPMHLSIDGPMQILSAVGAEGVDEYFVHFYRRRFAHEFRKMRRTLNSSEHLTRWHPLLSECFAAYGRQQYRVVTPALMLIIEGSVAELVGASGRKIQVPQVASGWTQRSDQGNWDWFGLRSVQRFLENLFGSHSFGIDRPAMLNRHWVLHGRDEPDWDEPDALRLFHCLATIDMVASFAKMYSTSDADRGA